MKKDDKHESVSKEEVLMINTQCNQNCIFCNLSFDSSGDKHDAVYHEKKIMKMLPSLKEKNIDDLIITGGEPTLDPKNLLKVIKASKKMGFTTKIITNGSTLLFRDFLDKIKDAGTDDILVSLHSENKEIHDKLTSTPGSYERIMKALELLSKKGMNFQISYVINSLNYKGLKDFAESMSSRFPKKKIMFCFVIPEGKAVVNEWIVPRIDEIRPYLIELFEYSRKNDDSDISINHNSGIPLCFFPQYTEFFEKLPYGHENKHETKKTFFEACQICNHKDKCSGVWKGYLKIHGDEEFRSLKRR